MPNKPGLGLASLAEQYQVLAGQEGILDLGYDRVLEADDAGEKLLAALDLSDEVLTDFLFDGRRLVTTVAQFGYGLRLTTLQRALTCPRSYARGRSLRLRARGC